MSKLKQLFTLALVALGIAAAVPSALAAAKVTCERKVVKANPDPAKSEEVASPYVLKDGFTYTAAPTTEFGGVFNMRRDATLTGANVVFKGNVADNSGGAICSLGTVALKDAVFTDNQTTQNGGAIYSSRVKLSLDNVTFKGNKAGAGGGAICNNGGGELCLDGPVTLVTDSDTILNCGTLNWNLADGKAGFLNAYQNISNVVGHSALLATVDDATESPVVLATGEFSNIETTGTDTFSITNKANDAAYKKALADYVSASNVLAAAVVAENSSVKRLVEAEAIEAAYKAGKTQEYNDLKAKYEATWGVKYDYKEAVSNRIEARRQLVAARNAAESAKAALVAEEETLADAQQLLTAVIDGDTAVSAHGRWGYKLVTEPAGETTNLVLYVIKYTCVRKFVTTDPDPTKPEEVASPYALENGFTYTAAPATEAGGAFKVWTNAVLTGANVVFKDNAAARSGGAIWNWGAVVLKDALFTGNKSKVNGGAIYQSGTLSLDNVTFEGNEAKLGGAICIGAASSSADLDGPVTLVTASDTLFNFGTLNWNLADGKQGLLNGYDKLTNAVGRGTLLLTVEDYAALPTNIVLATGEFSNIKAMNAETFSITNVAGGAALEIKINGSGVATGTEVGNTLYRLVTEEDAKAGTTNLVLQVYDITIEYTKLKSGQSTNLVAGVYTAAPATYAGGVFRLDWAVLTGTNVTFAANETANSGGAIINLFGSTVALKDATFTGNKAAVNGGAISGSGTLSLDNVVFKNNVADNSGGAISSSGTVHFDGPVTLVTTTDTILNFGTLNWNLADGKQGFLDGYQNVTNASKNAKLQLTVDAATKSPAVIATGDFTDLVGKDTFSITNVTSGAAATVKIGGLALLDGAWRELVVEGDQLVFRHPEMVKLTDVPVVDAETGATNATAVVTTEGFTIEPNGDGDYVLPKGYPVIVKYTIQDDTMFQAGLKERMVVLDPLTGDTSMAETGYKPVAEPRWAKKRAITFDTRERIVVGNVNDVLPLAYSTNHWGMAPAGYEVTIETQREDDPHVTVVDKAHENGYAEWLPELEAYGEYRVITINQMGVGGEMQTDRYLYYSQPYALKQAVDGNGTFDVAAYSLKDGEVLGYDFVDVIAKPAEGSEFVCWTLFSNGVEVVDAFEDARAITNRFEMPCADTKILAKFANRTGCTVNGQDIARGKGEGWEYTPATKGMLGTLQLRGDEAFNMKLSGKLPSHTKITAKASEDPMLKFITFENFTNDVSDCDAKVALTVPNFKDKSGTVYFVGENYLAAGARASAINVVMQDVRFMGTGSLTALPGTDKTVLPAIKCVLGTCTIAAGTYNDAVDPALVVDSDRSVSSSLPHQGAFSNGDGTWTVQKYYQVTFDPTNDAWMNVNDMTQRVVKGECAIKPATDPMSFNALFTEWLNKDGQQPYDFSKPVTKDIKLQAAYDSSEAAQATLLSDPVTLHNYAAGDLSNAVERVEEGAGIIIQQPNQVCEDIAKPMLICYTSDNEPTVTVVEDLAVTNLNAGGYYYTAIGERIEGAETKTNLVIVKGEAMPEVKSEIEPGQGTPEQVEKAENFVKTFTAENVRALPADKMYPEAVDLVAREGGGAVLSVAQLQVTATGLEAGAKGTLASVEMAITPVMNIYNCPDNIETPLDTLTLDGSDLSGEPVTVTFSVAALGQVPKLIEHELDSGDVEYFYHPDDVKAGEKSFDYDPIAKTVSFEMTSFSPVTVYFETEQFAVALDAGEDGYFGDPNFSTRIVYESTIGTGKYRNLVDPTPSKGGDFGGWYYGTETVANGVEFAKYGPHKLAAKWLYEQQVTVLASVGGTATGSGIYRVGSTVTVQAFPETNWEFSRWEADRVTVIGVNPTSFTMPANDVTITAFFQASAAYRKACADQVNADRAAAIDALNALPLTESEKALYLADIEETARKALVAVLSLDTPALVKAAADGAMAEMGKTLSAAEEDAEGRVAAWDVGSGVGPAVKAELTTEGELIISGIGPMADFGEDGAPWCTEAYATNVFEAIVSSNVTHIGSYAFKDCTELEKVDLTELTEFPAPFFGTGVFEGTEGVKIKVATSEDYKVLASDPSYRALDPRPMIVAPAVAFEFAKTELVTTEGEDLDVVVFGGNCDRSTAVTLNFVKGTYTSKPTAYVDGKKASFPITLNWARGEVGEKVVTLVTKKTSSVEEDRTFTLQLGSPAANETGDASVALVTVEDAKLPVESETAYVRALAWPANGGTVSGAGALKNASSKLTLKAKANKWATFAGWYLAKTNDVNQIDLEGGFVTFEKNLKVGAGTEFGEGTYYAYFTDVLPVASVVDPDETSALAEGVTYEDGAYCFKVGMYAQLPVGLDDESGKGSLTVSSLPSGLKYDKKTGFICGTPTKAGEKEVKIVAKNAAGKQTVYYTFAVEALPDAAVGTWNGLVRPLEDDGTHAGIGSVQFTASSSGKLSAKVTTRLSGTKSFSAKSYELVDENVYAVLMETSKGEVFEAKLYLTNDWKTAQLFGTVTGGAFEANGEECRFAAIKNAFDKKTGEAEAIELLKLFKGSYADALYLVKGGAEAGSVTFKVQDGGKVQVKAKSENGMYSASCPGAFRILSAGEKDVAAVQAAIRSGTKLWACDATVKADSDGIEGLACDYDAEGDDTHETIGMPVNRE